MGLTGLFLILVGLFAMCGAGFDWDWFMENRKAGFITLLFGGRTGARIFYLVLGLALLVWGLLDTFGIVGRWAN